MVDVKKTTVPAIVRRDKRTGESVIVFPEHCDCKYYHNGVEIARYSGLKNKLFLRTDIIGNDFRKTALQRAAECRIHGEYDQLFEMLGISCASQVSEYTYG